MKEKKEKAINTSQVSVDATFAASADDLYSILTDEKRIPAWSRASAKVCASSMFKFMCMGF